MAKSTIAVLNERKFVVVEGLAALVVAYIVGSRGLDTGSWWQYTGTVVLLGVALNRFFRTVHPTKK